MSNHEQHQHHHAPENGSARSCCHGHHHQGAHQHSTAPTSEVAAGTKYTCPMHPEVIRDQPGECPECGMALEPKSPPARATRTQWTCPMHPEVIRDQPGECPICGMALEPKTVTAAAPDNPELVDMTRRLIVSAALAVPTVVLAMLHLSAAWSPWVQAVLATPAVLWGGWPFFVRGARSIATRKLNMFTLIAIGVGMAWAYSVVAVLVPEIFPPQFRDAHGNVGVYFEAAAAIVTLVLLGQVLELRARSRTGAAIRSLL